MEDVNLNQRTRKNSLSRYIISMSKNKMKTIIVIGGGPAGMMAAYQASFNHNVILLESNAHCGRKLLLTGNGRCNVTNRREIENFLQHCSRSCRFLYSAFSQFDNYDLIKFFEDNNCPLIEEEDERMYPKTQKAQTVLDIFISLLKNRNVVIKYQTKAIDLIVDEKKIIGVKTDEQIINCDGLILATGGKSYPQTGSTGAGYQMLKKLEHSITDLYACEVPLVCQDAIIQTKELQGLSLQNVETSLIIDNKIRKSSRLNLLITHFGFSGPAALILSEAVSQHEVSKVTKTDCNLAVTHYKLDLDKSQSIAACLKQIQPKRWRDYLAAQIDFSLNLKLHQLSKEQKAVFNSLIFDHRFKLQGTLPIEKAFVTGGGLNTGELNPKTMKSKLIENLAVCGELLDCHGELGGYNLTIAMVTGYVAGKNF
ncbi:aminoacetone oxidase family FAD-binding enzyme [Treponema phagedenis]|uniref:Aminoacetone oxidase family FAD-binding enzyme n=3 Tax=Treponema phagedenis TaxID=162 RepID=A0AAE6ISM3_TREPH|nr:aminoacetone oxidase family FAD-binding enzyme [Treponema phagedenis]QEJ97597.1 aminoacetone oxidase family FAD-binding enzyme [Treponema phagedenis]QEK03163.1 aminoacetone oxidase family FAD-binding enzyme [Treponema phagedenis]QEK05573.1 aminoacetone oxidase family FAD-binding enzyme [Treponema phagedenis]QEK08789.1 aminoacetone oxidase family FAD-binding enzyme [Treponema phagedenis]